ncbi:fused MFS/spermidine synthase, partial [Candidatus Kaiserbacteria bacterium]|nr:fused MFS/spermidine synthase [Candidatus Kaiserbacteria bacterium]
LSGIIFLPKLLRRLPHYDQRNDMNVHYLILSVVIVVVVGTIVWVNSNRNSSSDIVYKDDGYYSHIEIIESTYDGKEVRLLKRDNNHSSGQFLDSDEFVFEYTKFSLLDEHLITEPKNFLMIGGGAYTIPKAIHDNYPNVAIDIIELEPSLYELAKEYFRFPESNRVTNHVGDARVFLNEIDTQYDMVFMDVFSTGHFVPPHLVTAEFFNNLKDNLTDDGVLIINFIGSQKTSTNKTITGSLTKTVMNVFPSVSVYRTYPKAIARPQNLMYIVRKNNLPTTLPNELTMDNLEDTHTFSELYIDTDKLVSNKDVVLTDNHNPAELLLLKERIFLW